MLELFGVDAENDPTVAAGYEWALMDTLRRARKPLHEDEIYTRIERTCQFMLEPINCGWIDLALGACVDHMMAQFYLEGIRFEKDMTCALCGGTNLHRYMNQWYGHAEMLGQMGRLAWRWDCHDCHRSPNLKHKTALSHSGVPYRNWCRALWCIAASPNGFTREEFRETIGMSRTRAHDMLDRISNAKPDDPLLNHWLPRLKRLDGRTVECEAGLHLVA